jgi:hypothetical protein
MLLPQADFDDERPMAALDVDEQRRAPQQQDAGCSPAGPPRRRRVRKSREKRRGGDQRREHDRQRNGAPRRQGDLPGRRDCRDLFLRTTLFRRNRADLGCHLGNRLPRGFQGADLFRTRVSYRRLSANRLP